MKNNKLAVIYARTASLEQVSQVNLLNQIISCLEYAKKKEYLVRNIFTDIGVSGSSTGERTELKRLINYVQDENIPVILTFSLDRISRNIQNSINFISLMQRNGKKIVTLSPSDSSVDSSKNLVKNMQMVFAQYDNELSRERSMRGTRKAYLSGRWLWKAPHGYVRTKGKILVDSKKGQKVTELYRLLANNEDIGVCKDFLCYQILNDKFSCSIRDLAQLICNPFYKGLMRSQICDHLVEGQHTPLIDKKTWNMANNYLKKFLYK